MMRRYRKSTLDLDLNTTKLMQGTYQAVSLVLSVLLTRSKICSAVRMSVIGKECLLLS